MSPSDEGLPPSQKVVVDGVTHVYYGPAQIQEGTAKYANDAEHNLEELHQPRSHVAVLHAGLKANEWQMGQSYAGLHAGIDLLKNGAASQKNKGCPAPRTARTLPSPTSGCANRVDSSDSSCQLSSGDVGSLVQVWISSMIDATRHGPHRSPGWAAPPRLDAPVVGGGASAAPGRMVGWWRGRGVAGGGGAGGACAKGAASQCRPPAAGCRPEAPLVAGRASRQPPSRRADRP
eukprot:COSAG04_NODE_1516_length_6479_cov_4.552194_7_plen_233_part_00